jgi:hypothetical protein
MTAGGGSGVPGAATPELELPTAGTVDVVVGCVDVDDPGDTPCANAKPVIIADAAAAAIKSLVISCSPSEGSTGEGRSYLPATESGASTRDAIGSANT